MQGAAVVVGSDADTLFEMPDRGGPEPKDG